MNNDDKSNRKNIKKKLAFSDDEIINDNTNGSKPANNNGKMEQTQNVNSNYEHQERLNSSYNSRSSQRQREQQSKEANTHKRSSSLTKSLNKQTNSGDLRSSRNRNGSTNLIYDYKSIYDAFEKPIDDIAAAEARRQNGVRNASVLNDSVMRNSVYGTSCVSSLINGGSTNISRPNSTKYDQTDLFRKGNWDLSDLLERKKQKSNFK
jgi:hypothetical protein